MSTEYPGYEMQPVVAFRGKINSHTRESLMAFEDRIRILWEDGELPSLLHLCGGNEETLIEIFEKIRPQDWVFISHRGHYHALLKGMTENDLEALIRQDRSMFIFDKYLRIFQSAILGGNCGIAVGLAKAIQDSGEDAHVYCFLGDGAADSGCLYESALYATGHNLPVTFIIENNNRQVDTDETTRRGPNHAAFSMNAPCIEQYYYEARWPHGGSGCAHQITFKRQHPLK